MDGVKKSVGTRRYQKQKRKEGRINYKKKKKELHTHDCVYTSRKKETETTKHSRKKALSEKRQ